MEDTFKKLLYAGVGLAATATERFEKTVSELVEKGKVTDSEGKRIVEEFLEKTSTKKDEFDEKFKSFVEKLGYTKNSDVAELRSRIEELEAQLAKGAKKAASAVADAAKA
ncbi:MAG: phasin family protein [Chitinophagales bacterium]|nr:phasin family protein [Chitinophagales bacterium]